ncbi:DMT family transporter [Costertonia aggregata]|uniref:DMT family transporter n=1 Tax=Costertonia aggregata TaxID=343403 RepID=A0A7H9AL00_9FLAO|nr:DMT family transporter [Costertonia aggregata]QLG44151.1 DMT family transporter [Costertonia aggregata]
MPNDKLKNYLHLHLIVFIWGFTALLGKLISIAALPLVWYRMLLASLIIGVYLWIKKVSLKVGVKTLCTMIFVGIVIALHWVTFFMAIKVSNVSIALATMSTGAFFTAFLEPVLYKRKIIWYEICFGILVIVGLYIIFQVETEYLHGIILALVSSFLAAIFSLMNGKLVKHQKPSIISFYELFGGVVFLTIYLLGMQSFTTDFFSLAHTDWIYIFILASACTAYAFIASVKVMRFISPYTVMLTVNLEPIYGMLLAFIVLGESEKMTPLFYLGGLLILLTVVANGVLKNKLRQKQT